jgi:hypothetical protein
MQSSYNSKELIIDLIAGSFGGAGLVLFFFPME